MAKVVLDQSKCIGCGACVAISAANAGGNFDFDDNGLSHVVNEVPTETTQDAIDSCPVSAISLVEDETTASPVTETTAQ